MSKTGGGEYKLLFLLPIFPDTGRILLLDIESVELAERLSAIGIECRTASIEDPEPVDVTEDGRYDVIIAGRMPAGGRGAARFVRLVDALLSTRGWLVTISPNRYGYSRLMGRAGSGKVYSSLPAMRRLMRKMGFQDIHAYSPVPDPANPTAFISLSGYHSLEFLLGQFPDFISARSGPARAILAVIIRTGLFRYVQNHYVVIAGGRDWE
jgi:hypothetical protein